MIEALYSTFRISSADGKIDKKSLCKLVVSLVVASWIGGRIAFVPNALLKTTECVKNAEILFLAVVMCFSFSYRCILEEKVFKYLYEEYREILEEVGKNWLGTMLGYLLVIIWSYLFKIFLIATSAKGVLIEKDFFVFCWFILIVSYLVFAIRTMLEIKSFFVNLYTMIEVCNEIKIIDKDK